MKAVRESAPADTAEPPHAHLARRPGGVSGRGRRRRTAADTRPRRKYRLLARRGAQACDAVSRHRRGSPRPRSVRQAAWRLLTGRFRGVAARLPRCLGHPRSHRDRSLVRRWGGPAVRPPAQGILPPTRPDQQRRPRPRSGPSAAHHVASRGRTRPAVDRLAARGRGGQGASQTCAVLGTRRHQVQRDVERAGRVVEPSTAAPRSCGHCARSWTTAARRSAH